MSSVFCHFHLAVAVALIGSLSFGMNIKSFSALLFYVALTRAHEGHSDEPVSGDATHYAQRHVRVVFHISRIFPCE
jgi:hypothetical protein